MTANHFPNHQICLKSNIWSNFHSFIWFTVQKALNRFLLMSSCNNPGKSSEMSKMSLEIQLSCLKLYECTRGQLHTLLYLLKYFLALDFASKATNMLPILSCGLRENLQARTRAKKCIWYFSFGVVIFAAVNGKISHISSYLFTTKVQSSYINKIHQNIIQRYLVKVHFEVKMVTNYHLSQHSRSYREA